MTQPRPLQTPGDVSRTLSSGSACVVLVEGPQQASDAWILKSILLKTVGEEVTFLGRGGRLNVLAELPELLVEAPNERVFGLLDRDFLEDEFVEASYAPGYSGHLFFWRRFTIENYLLEPAWVAEAIDEFYMHTPERIPETLKTAKAVEGFLLNACQRLATQVAGNWTISQLVRETGRQNLSVQARQYFDDLIERGAEWVLAELTQHYSGWGHKHPEFFTSEALQARFQNKLTQVSTKIQIVSGAHEIVSGKMLMKALYAELPSGPKPRKEYVRNRLVRMASAQVPDDMRILIEDRILPRWRKARNLA